MKKVFGVATLMTDGKIWMPPTVYTSEKRAQLELREYEDTVPPDVRRKDIQENYICVFNLNESEDP